MQSEQCKQKVQLTLFYERLVNSGNINDKTHTVVTSVPFTLTCSQDNAYQIQQILNSIIVDSVISHLEQISDVRTVQALDHYLSEFDTSLSRLCQQPQKIADALYSLYNEGAEVVIEQIIFVSYRRFGFKYDPIADNKNSDKRSRLSEALVTLKRKVLENQQRRSS